MPNCDKWSCMTHFKIFAWEEINFLKLVIKIDFWGKIPLWWIFLKDMVITYQFDVLLNDQINESDK
jgi:hypothetical protein